MKKLILALMVAGVVSSVVAQAPKENRSLITIELKDNASATITVTGDEVYGDANNAEKLKKDSLNDNSYTDASYVDASADYNADNNSVTITDAENVAPEATLGEEIA